LHFVLVCFAKIGYVLKILYCTSVLERSCVGTRITYLTYIIFIYVHAYQASNGKSNQKMGSRKEFNI